jgi:hypothetical protein
MNATSYRTGMGWGARLAIGLALLLVGAAAATWALAHYQPAARMLGVLPPAQPAAAQRLIIQPQVTSVPANPLPPGDAQKINDLEQRLARVESATHQAQGSAGRADALVIAFAARRAIDRGVALGYLEPLLSVRFGPQHQQAVATIITAAHQPIRLSDLIAQYQALGPQLRSGGPGESWWTDFKREFGTLVQVHRAGRPPSTPEARYNRALQLLSGGDVDDAVAETMRLPAAGAASAWVANARRYIAAHRALDELESASLMGGIVPQG